MLLPEVFHSMRELDALKEDWRVAFCGNGPLTLAIRSQLTDQPKLTSALLDMGRILVVDDGEDVATITKLSSLLHEAGAEQLPATFIVNIIDQSLVRAIETRCLEDKISPRPVFVSEANLIAEYAMSQCRLFQTAKWRNQSKINVALLGFSPLGRAFLSEILLDGVASGLGMPSIEIITSDVEQAKATLDREMPEIAQSAEIKVTPLVVEELGNPLASPIVRAEDENPLTAIFILLDDPKQTFRAVAELCALQDLHGRGHAALFVGGSGATIAVAHLAPRRAKQNLAMQISVLDNLQALPDLLGNILVGRDVVAKRIHQAYEVQYVGQTGAGTSWENLTETYRRANRRAAAHLVQKLDVLGIDMSAEQKLSGFVDQAVYDHLILPLAKSSVEDKSMRELARLEHERWCADRRLDGWRFGEIRDDSRRLHPSLVPFDDPRLTADEIGKDVSQLRFLLGSVVKAGPGGATKSLSIGIVSGTDQPGIDGDMLRARFALEPERAVILISPVLNAAELKVVGAILVELRTMNRDARLVIPEWFANNATLRDAEIAQIEAMKMLVTDEECWIAPIGPQRFSASAEWDEVIVAETRRQALVDYVISRSDVLLAVQSSDLPA